MPDFSLGTTILGGVLSNRSADKAADVQRSGQDASIAEQQRQFDAIRELLSPFVKGGTFGLEGQKDVIGQMRNWGDTGLQQVMDNPLTQGLIGQMDDAILANASATGGLRGGNTQRSLADSRVNLLSALENQQYGRLGDLYNSYGGLTQIGYGAAGGQANANAQFAKNMSNAYGNIGAIGAGEALANGRIMSRGLNQIGGILAANNKPRGFTPDMSWNEEQDFSQWGGGRNDYQGYY